MAPRSKKRKGSTSTAAEPEEEYDASKFVSAAAQKRYVASVVKKWLFKRGVYMLQWIVFRIK